MEKTNKHAYLIMAHDNFEQLKILLDLIDDYRNDIYLHIDKKAKIDISSLGNQLRYSRLFMVPRLSVSWGDFSQILCEYQLIKTAVDNGDYQYLHLLSGLDLPIKTQDEIHEFFSNNEGQLYVEIVDNTYQKEVEQRCKYYWFFQNRLSRHNQISILRIINWLGIKIQKFIGLNRIPENINIKKGANWFSITGDFAKYIVNKKDFIFKQFQHTVCADELFIQTILYNSEYHELLSSQGCKRLVDWNRGNPYVFRKTDYSMICNSDEMFARKFDVTVDKEIVESIIHKVKG